MVTLDALVVVTALPSVHRDLGGSFDTLHWTVNDSNSAFAAGIITAAAVGDRIGRRRVYTFGLGLFTAASAACALAPSASAWSRVTRPAWKSTVQPPKSQYSMPCSARLLCSHPMVSNCAAALLPVVIAPSFRRDGRARQRTTRARRK